MSGISPGKYSFNAAFALRRESQPLLPQALQIPHTEFLAKSTPGLTLRREVELASLHRDEKVSPLLASEAQRNHIPVRGTPQKYPLPSERNLEASLR